MTARWITADVFDRCEECGELWPCLHDNPPISAVEREDDGGWAHGYWDWEDA